MWKDIGEASQLVLGIAIALYTLYEFATRYLERRPIFHQTRTRPRDSDDREAALEVVGQFVQCRPC